MEYEAEENVGDEGVGAPVLHAGLEVCEERLVQRQDLLHCTEQLLEVVLSPRVRRFRHHKRTNTWEYVPTKPTTRTSK